jgi:nickel superoxide dismutase
MVISRALLGHCQIPCGIYHDDLTFQKMYEQIETLSKAVAAIEANHHDKDLDLNQFIRWVLNKDHQADDFAAVVSTYFLQQRILEDHPQRDLLLRQAHDLLRISMKVKQTVDSKLVDQLQSTLKTFESTYQSTKPKPKT